MYSDPDHPNIKGLDLNLGGGSDMVDFIPLHADHRIDLGAGDDFITIQDPERHSQWWTGPEVDTFSLEKFDGGDNGEYGDHLSFRYYDMGAGSNQMAEGAELTLGTAGAVNFENLTGTTSDDIIRGDEGDNKLAGYTGKDIIYGGSGNDLIKADRLDMFPSNDHLRGDWVDDDELYGESGDDLLVGNNGNNILDGGEGSDTLVGGDGNDIWFPSQFLIDSIIYSSLQCPFSNGFN